MAAWDSSIVARAIARCPVPVLTALGHATARTVADLVAYGSYETPSAAAGALVGRAEAAMASERTAGDRQAQLTAAQRAAATAATVAQADVARSRRRALLAAAIAIVAVLVLVLTLVLRANIRSCSVNRCGPLALDRRGPGADAPISVGRLERQQRGQARRSRRSAPVPDVISEGVLGRPLDSERHPPRTAEEIRSIPSREGNLYRDVPRRLARRMRTERWGPHRAVWGLAPIRNGSGDGKNGGRAGGSRLIPWCPCRRFGAPAAAGP